MEELTEEGVLREPWQSVFLAVPRPGRDGRGEMPTSSASRPDIAALMLAAGQVD